MICLSESHTAGATGAASAAAAAVTRTTTSTKALLLDQALSSTSPQTSSPNAPIDSYPAFFAPSNDNTVPIKNGTFCSPKNKSSSPMINDDHHSLLNNSYPPNMFHAPISSEMCGFESQASDSSGSRFYKTRRCLFHQRGACAKGDKCTYAHSDDELKPTPDLIKTRLCQDWLNNICASKSCKFAHGRHELRYTHDFYKTKICHFWHQGGCTKGSLCRHAHGQQEMRPQPNNSAEAELPHLIGGTTPSRDSTRSTSNSSPAWGAAEPSGSRQTYGASGFAAGNFRSSNAPTAPKSNRNSKYDVLHALRLAEEAKRLAEKSAALLARTQDRPHNRTHDSSLSHYTPNYLCEAALAGHQEFNEYPPSFSSDLDMRLAANNSFNIGPDFEAENASSKITDMDRSFGVIDPDYLSSFRPQPLRGEGRTPMVDLANGSDRVPDMNNMLAALPSLLLDNDLDIQSFIELLGPPHSNG